MNFSCGKYSDGPSSLFDEKDKFRLNEVQINALVICTNRLNNKDKKKKNQHNPLIRISSPVIGKSERGKIL